MSPLLANLEPRQLWKHFEKLSAIPRPSGQEAAAREYVRSVAAAAGLENAQDAAGNLLVRKPAKTGRESAPAVLLQGHLDMVCEKNEGTPHDFSADAIQLRLDGDWVKADGTTLGADNGIGVAAALAVMEDREIAHGPLEFLFTTDEEVGLTGAAEFAAGVLRARYYLNLDSEEIGSLCIGCAGGLDTTARRQVRMVPASAGDAWRIKVSGLRGGHSGVDIHQGRGNALRILGGVLQELLRRVPAEIAEVSGGSARNAIPREAAALVVVPSGGERELQSVLAEGEAAYRAELGAFDPGLQISGGAAQRPATVLNANDAANIVAVLACLPHGVLAMSPAVPGLVQTSTNLAIVRTNGDAIEVLTNQRSSIASSKETAARRVATICRMAGFEVEVTGSYPGWQPDPHSELVEKLQSVHQRLFGEPAKLIAMHAGLECGVIGEKYPGMQMISFGPTIVDPHSPNERVQISTVASFWRFLAASLQSL